MADLVLANTLSPTVAPLVHTGFWMPLLGAALSLILCVAGAGYGMVKHLQLDEQHHLDGSTPTSGKQQINGFFVGPIMSAALAIYGLIIAMIIVTNTSAKSSCLYPEASLVSGIVNGFCSLLSGISLGQLAGMKGSFPKKTIAWVWAESLAIFGLITAIMMLTLSRCA